MGLSQLVFGDQATILRDPDFRYLVPASTLPILGTALVSPVLDSLIEPFGASSASIGLMISAFIAPAIVMIPITGILADRYGRKPVLLVSILLFGIGGTAVAFTADFRLVLALRFLQGVGNAGINPLIITSLGDLFTGEREATGQGIRFMVSGLSGAVFPLFAGALVLLAWQYPFLMYTMAFPVALLLYIGFEEPTTANEPRKRSNHQSYTSALVELGRQRRVLAMAFARAFMPLIWIGFLTYNSLIVVRLMDGTPVQAGILASAGFIVFAFSASQAGRVTSFFDSRFIPLVIANIGLAGGFIIVLFAPNLSVAIPGIIIAGSGFGLLGSLYRSIVTGFAPTEIRAGLVSLTEAGGWVTGTLTPLAMGGFIAVASPNLGFALSLQLAGLGIALIGGGGGILSLLLAHYSPPVQVTS